MEGIIVKMFEELELKNCILIEGLPGVGNVGKIAAEYLSEKVKAKKLGEIYSRNLPPQVLINEDGTIKMVKNEIFYKKGKQDILILTGDYQALSSSGQYDLSYKILEIAKKCGVKRIYTLGGYGTGKLIDEPRVLGAATNQELVEEMKKYNVTFSKTEPGGGIVGASGLLLGLGSQLFDIDGVCLMGETSGYFSDPKGAQELLKVLTKILNIKLDFSDLEEKAKKIEELASQIKEDTSKNEKKEYLGYFG